MKRDTMISLMPAKKVKEQKHSDDSGVGVFASIFALVVGLFGVIAFFVSMMVNIDENPSMAMKGGVMLLLLAVATLYYSRKRKPIDDAKGVSEIPETASVKRLNDRLENLEALICRLDLELNQQIEQSLILTNSAPPRPGDSQMPTTLLSLASALDDRFQMLRELGHGGMGVVIQAYDKQLKEQVAIKVLSPVLSYNPEAVERLRREVSAARRITHPNVIRIHDISEANKLSYVSMEYFEGVNLKEFIRQRGLLSIPLSYQIAMQICDGLEAAHQQGVIHRDLKPQNIIVNRSNQIKIIDFGLARSKHVEGMTATGLIMGTPEYMAPEQVSGKNVDERSDIYSFGIILYELVTGKVPFAGESAISIGFKQMRDDPPLPRSLNPRIPQELERVICKALQKDPDDRYATCADLRTELKKALAPASSGITPESKEASATEVSREQLL